MNGVEFHGLLCNVGDSSSPKNSKHVNALSGTGIDCDSSVQNDGYG